jgi:hypothetical protein
MAMAAAYTLATGSPLVAAVWLLLALAAPSPGFAAPRSC